MHVTTIKYGYVLCYLVRTIPLYLLILCIDLLCIIQTTMPQHNYTIRIGTLYKGNEIEGCNI